MTQGHSPTRQCRWCDRIERRTFFGLLTAGLATAVGGCCRGELVGFTRSLSRTEQSTTTSSVSSTPTTTSPPPMTTTTTAPVVELDAIPVPRPGPAHSVFKGPFAKNDIAITIDDGFCTSCAQFYVSLAQTTGIHLTLSPNGVYRSIWEPLAPALRLLVEAGQVQIGNHTYNHYNLLGLSNAGVQAQIDENERWIEDAFGITARPWLRPPYGYHDARIDAVAGELGYTNILLWNGSFGDSTPISPGQLLNLATQFLRPGTIMLGHANYPTIEAVWTQIEPLIVERGLSPVTLDEMFGTSRNTG